MKIYEYNEMMRYLTRPAPDPSIKQLAASNPLGFPEHMIHQYEGGQLTPEEFYQHQSIPQSERPLTGAQGGRVQMKPGGLVEPGVTHYATLTKAEETANINAWEERMKVLGKKYADVKDKQVRYKIRQGRGGDLPTRPIGPLNILLTLQLELFILIRTIISRLK